MTERDYFEQFAGDTNVTKYLLVDGMSPEEFIAVSQIIPPFDVRCPMCHGTGFVEQTTARDRAKGFSITAPCYRCWELVGR